MAADRQVRFLPNILRANCLLLSHTQLYLQPLSENTARITHEQGVAYSQSVNMDLTAILSHTSLTVYLYFPGFSGDRGFHHSAISWQTVSVSGPLAGVLATKQPYLCSGVDVRRICVIEPVAEQRGV